MNLIKSCENDLTFLESNKLNLIQIQNIAIKYLSENELKDMVKSSFFNFPATKHEKEMINHFFHEATLKEIFETLDIYYHPNIIFHNVRFCIPKLGNAQKSFLSSIIIELAFRIDSYWLKVDLLERNGIKSKDVCKIIADYSF